jgi:hypothetical protein
MKIALALGPLLLLLLPSLSAAAPDRAPVEPCGYVSFVPAGPPRVVSGTFYERVKAMVVFSDGHAETAEFPYYWVYPNGEQTDPWSSTNMRRPDFTTTMQSPPPGTDTKTFAPVLQYVLAHTGANGYTNLRECSRAPGISPPAPTYDAAAEYARAMATTSGWTTIIDDSPPDSPVKIVSAATFGPRDTAPGQALPARDCVTFWNRSPKTVTSITFSFAHYDAGGELKLIHQFDRLGTFAPGVVVEGPRQPKSISFADSVALKNCRLFFWSWKIGANRVAVTSADFDDGSTWTPGPRTPAPAPRR